jgi:uncharacterized protein YbcV (DUF1398 family)
MCDAKNHRNQFRHLKNFYPSRIITKEKIMNQERILGVYAAVRASATGEIPFPQIIARLAELGVQRYHADYARLEKTFYFADGQSMVTNIPLGEQPIGEEFSAAAVESAVRQSQRNEHTYADFVRKTMAAGCVGYFVHITGRHALYFGRKGEMHREPFPTAPSNSKN